MVTDRGPHRRRAAKGGLSEKLRGSGWPPIPGIAWIRIEAAQGFSRIGKAGHCLRSGGK